MKTNQVEMNDSEISNNDLTSFEAFAEKAVTIHPMFETIYMDGELKAKYEKASSKEKLSFFDPKLVDTLKGIYLSTTMHVQSRNDLAIHIFSFREMTERTLEEVAGTLSDSLGKTLSRSYVHKLYHAGRVMLQVPALKEVTDTEKLAAIAKIPEADLAASVVVDGEKIRLNGTDLQSTSRGKLSEEIKRNHPTAYKCGPKREASATIAAPIEVVDGPLMKLKSAIEIALAQGLDSELETSLKGALALVETRLPK